MGNTRVPEHGLEVRLVSRPSGWPDADNFDIVAAPIQQPVDGQIVVRNRIMSVDPYMRGRMNDTKSYVPPYEIGNAMDGAAVGEVIASRSPEIAVGTTVQHRLGWREYAVLDHTDAAVIHDPDVPISAYLGVLGMTGLSAYVGLFDKAAFTPRDTVFVSGAAGGVGSLVGQMAKLRGAPRVIGSAGSAEKVRYLTDDLGFDAAFNYKDGPVLEQLRAAAPDGIDVYFDNVGADHLEAAIDVLNVGGRIAACGAVAQYNAKGPVPGPSNLFQVVTKRLTMRGFIVSDSVDRRPDFHREVGQWVRDGRLRYDETVVHGIANAPTAFLDMLRGRNTGKMLVTLDNQEGARDA
ncbi:MULTISPECIES: NADP-dependent oxidoreductase [Rhodococcus]|uniref:NADP-dependent oxidoreductase n=1 Tax=Rhodococcus oxybenzonivorans TaxID=1990687 RepID=A0AAE4UVW9_9NOCA|nr:MULTISPECIES: NADP-dependent oxidoreductase [Rhodococcus]MDV7243364.1 NADP-dependent oxidoreductase [Rhodococcus oxybenzonivorans]MDV7263936.1 NADP-dependent oxidoreductase [Rhodococcus oxybenzonivorans]MDV7276790.1 NADP-dependent oxidoreductase [Rhodococcus oxybenzonivorans]MDV7334376.1 NADP-dependent oxidoreductase [Rhodococcus oxybenzonivorans]MDV7344531.1 NADP-dependent oxidoreductase [Rhodococcus oxybenzonivorans]